MELLHQAQVRCVNDAEMSRTLADAVDPRKLARASLSAARQWM